MRAGGSIYEGLKLYINLLKVLESCKVLRWKVCGLSVQCLIAAPSNLNLWNQLEILGSFKLYSLNPELRFVFEEWCLTILELSRLSVGIWVLSRILEGQKLLVNLLKILEGCKVWRWKSCGWFVFAALLNLNVTPPSKNTLEASLPGLIYWCCCLHRCFIFSRFLEGLHYWIAGTCKIWGG